MTSVTTLCRACETPELATREGFVEGCYNVLLAAPFRVPEKDEPAADNWCGSPTAPKNFCFSALAMTHASARITPRRCGYVAPAVAPAKGKRKREASQDALPKKHKPPKWVINGSPRPHPFTFKTRHGVFLHFAFLANDHASAS